VAGVQVRPGGQLRVGARGAEFHSGTSEEPDGGLARRGFGAKKNSPEFVLAAAAAAAVACPGKTPERMDQTTERISRTLWVGIGFVIVLLCIAFVLSRYEPRRPASRQPLPVIGPVADFALTNQQGRAVSLADLRGHVWVADIIFTRCAGPCPIMTKEMKELQDALPPANQTRLVTLTTDPDFDTPPVMKTYSERFGADPARWTFLTGTKKEIGALAMDSLKLSAVPVKPEDRQNDADLFIHTTIFVVVDKQARLRGVFETGGEGVDWPKSKRKILAAVRQLESEP
jgi:protein SCO1/2